MNTFAVVVRHIFRRAREGNPRAITLVAVVVVLLIILAVSLIVSVANTVLVLSLTASGFTAIHPAGR